MKKDTRVIVPRKIASGEVPRDAALPVMRIAVLQGVIAARDLRDRVKEVLRARKWRYDEDVLAVLCAALACEILGAGDTAFRRPPGAVRGLRKRWPVTELDCPACTVAPLVQDIPRCSGCGGARKIFRTTFPAWYLIQELELEDLVK